MLFGLTLTDRYLAETQPIRSSLLHSLQSASNVSYPSYSPREPRWYSRLTGPYLSDRQRNGQRRLHSSDRYPGDRHEGKPGPPLSPTVKQSSQHHHLQLLLAHEVLYVVIIHLTKLVILCVYLRILPLHTMPLLRFLVPITKAVVAAAGFGQAVALIFQCTPVHYFWDRLKDARSGGHCINVNAWGWANAAINLLMDFWIIALPLPEIFKLKLYWKEKVKVTLMLAVGSL